MARTPAENFHYHIQLSALPQVEAGVARGESVIAPVKLGSSAARTPIERAMGVFFGNSGTIVNATQSQAVLGLLLERGAVRDLPPRAQARLLWTLSDRATRQHTHYLAPYLADVIAQGARLDTADKSGNTALHLALAKGMASWGKLLIEHGADVHRPNAQGKSPLDLLDDAKLRRWYPSTTPQNIRNELLASSRQQVLAQLPEVASTPVGRRPRQRA